MNIEITLLLCYFVFGIVSLLSALVSEYPTTEFWEHWFLYLLVGALWPVTFILWIRHGQNK